MSIPTWETLEGWIRDEIEVRIQSIAEEEVTQFLGRGWYERKGAVDTLPGYRNGYGKPPVVEHGNVGRAQESLRE